MKNPNNWVKYWVAVMILLFILIMASCNTVKKAERKIQEQTTTIYLRDTVHVKIVDTSRVVTELQEFNTKTIELYDTSYHDVPVIRQRIIYTNSYQQRTNSFNGITRDSAAGSVSNTKAVSSTITESSKKSNRIPFTGIIILGFVIIVLYVIRKAYRIFN